MAGVTLYRTNDRLTRALSIVKDLPPLSPMVRRLLATLYSAREDTSLSQIAIWIEKDTLTAGKVLALANSAYYARTEPIVSIRHAVSRLGLYAIRNLALSMSMSRYWNRTPTAAEWSCSRFNAHSIGTAVLSEMIASALMPENMEAAFLAGLFHDVGHVAIAVLLRDNPDAIKQLAREEHAALEQLELELVGFSHSVLSAAIVRSWNLPASVENAVLVHEAPIEAKLLEPGGVELSDIVHVADCFVDYEGLSISGARKQAKDLRALWELGLSIKDSMIFKRFRDELDILLSVL